MNSPTINGRRGTVTIDEFFTAHPLSPLLPYQRQWLHRPDHRPRASHWHWRGA